MKTPKQVLAAFEKKTLICAALRRTLGKLMMLPSDLALVQDKNFRPFVQMYAKDNAMFVKDFTAAYTKLTELGTKNLKAVALA